VEDLPLDEMDWLGDFVGGVRRGGVYLLGGSPGSRKSGLALQLALDLTLNGMRSLFLLSEETPARLYDRSFPMMAEWTAQESCHGITHIATETMMPPLVDLPLFVTQQMANEAQSEDSLILAVFNCDWAKESKCFDCRRRRAA
jgi:hypothetical protein